MPGGKANDVNLAVLASWCAEDVHFSAPVSAPVCKPALLQSAPAAIAVPSPALDKAEDLLPIPGLEGPTGRIGLTAAQQNHEKARLRSIAILSDYFKAVAENNCRPAANMEKKKGPGLSTRLFLLLCPPQPRLLQREHLTQGVDAIGGKTSTLLATYAFVLLPAWLWLVRELWRRGFAAAAALLLWLGLVLVSLAFFHRQRQHPPSNGRNRVAARFVPGTVSKALPPLTPPLAPARPQLPPSIPPRAPVPGPASSPPPAAAPAPRPSAAIPPRLPPQSRDPLEAVLQGDILAVQQEVYGSTVKPPEWNKEVMLAEINRLCGEVGIPKLDTTADLRAMAARLHSVKNTVGMA